MLRLEAAIDVIAATEAERRRQEQGQRGPVAISEPAALRFISRVVQIRFNAWHFGDANLWASLTAEFFDQLRSGGFARQGAEIHSRLVERVNAYVHSLSLALAASKPRRAVKPQTAPPTHWDATSIPKAPQTNRVSFAS